MFKFSPPTMKVILSSGSFLTLIALGCLVVMSTSVHTSDIVDQNRSEDSIGATASSTTATRPAAAVVAAATAASNSDEQQDARAPPTKHSRQASGGDSRQRSGRLYAPGQQQQQSPLESYAAAYAAANSGAGADQSALSQQSVAAGSQSSAADTNAYTSFGEAPPPASTIGSGQSASIARQLSSSPSDYSAHSNYFAGYMSPSSNEASYSAGLPSSGGYYPSPSNHHHHHHHKAHQQLPLGYPTNAMYERGFNPISTSSYYDRIAHSSAAAASSPFWATSGLGGSSGGGGLMSSASHALSHWTNGFSIGEIICGLVAIAIGAIILGAPFFLIYLALMGNFSGSGTLSLTNPTSATGAAGGAAAPANGRRKRLAVFEAMSMGEQVSNKHPELAAMVDSVAKSLSPYVNLQQVSSTFKQLVSSIEKYSSNQSDPQAKRAKADHS